MGKPIKEWGVVKFLSKKLPKAAGDIAANVADVVISGKPVSKAIGDIVRGSDSGNQLSPEDIAKAYELAEQDHKEYLAELEDRQDARAMQIENLKHGDTFTKRFVYWYAAVLTLLAIFLVVLLFFVEIPDDNKRVVDMSLGVIFGVGLSGVFQYFFGSSQGSKNKEGIISNVMEKLK